MRLRHLLSASCCERSLPVKGPGRLLNGGVRIGETIPTWQNFSGELIQPDFMDWTYIIVILLIACITQTHLAIGCNWQLAAYSMRNHLLMMTLKANGHFFFSNSLLAQQPNSEAMNSAILSGGLILYEKICPFVDVSSTGWWKLHYKASCPAVDISLYKPCLGRSMDHLLAILVLFL